MRLRQDNTNSRVEGAAKPIHRSWRSTLGWPGKKPRKQRFQTAGLRPIPAAQTATSMALGHVSAVMIPVLEGPRASIENDANPGILSFNVLDAIALIARGFDQTIDYFISFQS